jgi:hypothetical protein
MPPCGNYKNVIPAKAGIQTTSVLGVHIYWIPAFAGMTFFRYAAWLLPMPTGGNLHDTPR